MSPGTGVDAQALRPAAWRGATATWRQTAGLSDRLACLVITGLSLAGLLLGGFAPDERLTVSGLPLNTVVSVIVMMVALAVPVSALRVRVFATAALLLLPAGFTLLWSGDAAYGGTKFFNLLATSLAGFVLLGRAIDRYGTRLTAQSLILVLAGLLAAALAYKLQAGLFDRQVPFLVSGPITFGRLMGVGALLSLLCIAGPARLALASMFLVALLWTMSKGPLVAWILTLVLAFFISFDSRERALTLLFAGLSLVAAAIAIASLGNVDLAALGRLGALVSLGSIDLSTIGGFDSVTGRLWLAARSVDLISAYPLGVGLGGWGVSVVDGFGKLYPHNLPLELWSEAGLIAGSLALMPFVAVCVAARSPWGLVGVFFLLTQIFSGDLLDARYALVFSLLALSLQLGDRDHSGRRFSPAR